MKCIKNQKTGNIIRVDDQQAYQMVGITWQYVTKSEWKSSTRAQVNEKQEVEAEKKEKTLSNKAKRRAKFKTDK